MRWMRWAVTALLAGSVLGLGTALVNHVPIHLDEVGTARADRSGLAQAAEFVSLILDSGWAWAALAVVVGRLVSHGVRPAPGILAGALAGCVSLLAATMVYDALEALLQDGTTGGWRQQFWLAASVLAGPFLGAAGAATRRPGPVGVVAALVVPVGAALNMIVLPPAPDSRMAVPVTLTVWAAAALAAVVVLARGVRARSPHPDPAAAEV
ncbi:DUF6518 family protein [Actinoplanes sp. DH11]|uniref:DUF6518 family protein n=1 Tax=Actinoplanes sp. DH11 TaxID=2857011 RepID=UPI001E447A2A|nr:DUF6518 family protein [Actinoplanes sp. DH11]